MREVAEDTKMINLAEEEEPPGAILRQAVNYDNVELLESLLLREEKEHINTVGADGTTALYTAVARQNPECCHILIEAGADVNIQCGPKVACQTALHLAVRVFNPRLVGALLSAGAHWFIPDSSGTTALKLAETHNVHDVLHIIKQHAKQIEDEFIAVCKAHDVEGMGKLIPSLPKTTVAKILNMRSSSSHKSLLHIACEKGNSALVAVVMKNNDGDPGVHLMTGQSPLHAACGTGDLACTQLILQRYPELIQAPTMEARLPLHEVCARGHLHILQVLLNFKFPDHIVKTFKESNGVRMYRLGFDINAKDGHGRTPLHVACAYQHVDIVQELLNFHTKVTSKYSEDSFRIKQPSNRLASVRETTKRLCQSEGGQRICEDGQKSHGSRVSQATQQPNMNGSQFIHPVAAEIDSVDLKGGTPLHIAVRTVRSSACTQIAELLLKFGANANKPVISSSGNQSALTFASDVENTEMVNVLLSNGAKDEDNKVLSKAITAANEELISVFLRYKSHLDKNNRVNVVKLSEKFHMSSLNAMSLTWHGSMNMRRVWPNNPVVLEWRSLGLLCLEMSWMSGACLYHNKPRASLNLSIPLEELSLYAITLIDISDNELTQLPLEIFRLQSLRSLIASGNIIHWLPGCPIQVPKSCSCLGGILQRSSTVTTADVEITELPVCSDTCVHRIANEESERALDDWQCPVLEEVNFQNNKLNSLPRALCKLPSLKKLNVAFNNLSILPSDIWSNPSLMDLNVSHNTLTQLFDTQQLRSSWELESVKSVVSQTETDDFQVSQDVSKNPAQNDYVSIKLPGYTKAFASVPLSPVRRWSDGRRMQHDSSSASPRKNERNQHLSNKLTELNASHNKLSNVPAELACLTPCLETLNLAHNQLQTLGAPRNFPARLCDLDVSHNALKTMMRVDNTEEEAKARARPCCSLTDRAARHRSSGQLCRHRLHTNLMRLRTLRLCHNDLTVLDFRAAASITKPPLSPCAKRKPSSSSPLNSEVQLYFPQLSCLDLGDNKISTLTPDIALHSCLSECKLQNNTALTELPCELGLTKVWNLELSGCRVRDQLQALLGDKARQTLAVLGYLKSLKENAKPYNRMKLMFVGIQGIGKTSLLQSLRSSKAQVTWAERMGHTTMKGRDHKGENISTVGVDIGQLQFEKDGVIFSTWDFGGQREYYATHQYFLSRRSLYLLVWNLCDGETGVTQLMQWLVNIQARAPSSPVIIVGTHLDLIKEPDYPAGYLESLRSLIHKKYIAMQEPEKCGLPRVVDQIEVCTRQRFFRNDYIKDLKAKIMETVRKNSTDRGLNLITQRVPAIYIQLEEVVAQLAEQRKGRGLDPVLDSEHYRNEVLEQMERQFATCFRDSSELSQATQFLHENGVLLHYDDPSLQHAYFLDPQWLCDILASVVTVREINSHAPLGIMKADDLKMLFKSGSFRPDDIRTYVIQLLNKFEVALLFDDKHLLIPSMLPSEEQVRRHLKEAAVTIPVKGSRYTYKLPEPPVISMSLQSTKSQNSGLNVARFFSRSEKPGVVHKYQQRPSYVVDSRRNATNGANSPSSPCEPSETSPSFTSIEDDPLITCISNPANCIIRLYLMSYFPSGFWPRLLTRLLGDSTFEETARSVYELPELLKANDRFLASADAYPLWRCWQTGVRLDYLGSCLLRVKEVSRDDNTAFCDYRQCRIMVSDIQEPLQLNQMSILEILLPNEALSVAFDRMPLTDACSMTDSMFMNLVIRPNPQHIAAMLNKVVDHIDTLLGDWYPDLGERFVQNTKGMYLITRLVPCIRCLVIQSEIQSNRLESRHAWSMVEVNPRDASAAVTSPVLVQTGQTQANRSRHLGVPGTGTRANAASRSVPKSTSNSEEMSLQRSPNRKKPTTIDTATLWNGWFPNWAKGGQGSVGADVARHNRDDSPEIASLPGDTSTPDCGDLEGLDENIDVHCYLAEQCMQASQCDRSVYCPVHGILGPYFVATSDGCITHGHISPDTVFQDLGDESLIQTEQIERGRFLGRGAFGAVYAGTMVNKHSGEHVAVAMKMMEPVEPDPSAPRSAHNLYKAEKIKWAKEPMKKACEAYLNMRKELSILMTLQHKHIVPLLGVSTHPLCLVLDLAPQGSLNQSLEDYSKKGVLLPVFAVHRIIQQVASALAYLHAHHIIYRDLKSENVLVWRLPSSEEPFCEEIAFSDECDDSLGLVHVKIADYGVSRSVLPWGTKGLAGTPPFIAPEIIRHKGEETYTEKVDCYSFGMFIYELINQRLPFVDDATTHGDDRLYKDSYVVDGGRPPITYKEASYPTYILELMTLCWAQDPCRRPSARQIEALCEWPEFTQLCNTVCLPESMTVTAALAAPHMPPPLLQHVEIGDGNIIPEVDEDEEEPSCGVWLALSPETDESDEQGGITLAVCTYTANGCGPEAKGVTLPIRQSRSRKRECSDFHIDVMCASSEHVWCADSLACVHLFSMSSLEKVCEFAAVEGKKKAESTVQTMVYAPHYKKMFLVVNNVAMDCTIVVCCSSLAAVGDNPVLLRHSVTGFVIHTSTVVNNNSCEELWCGHTNEKDGEISIWNIDQTEHGGDGYTSSLNCLRRVAHEKNKQNLAVHIVRTDQESSAVWSYVYPGTEVYRWDVYSREVTHSLDLSQVAPEKLNDPLTRFTDNGFFVAGYCQVVSMCLQAEQLFVGTTLGSLLVLHKHTLMPLSLLLCNTEQMPLNMLLPVTFTSPASVAPSPSAISADDSFSQSSTGESVTEDDTSQVISICRGYLDVTSYVLPREGFAANENTRLYMSAWRASRGWQSSAKLNFR